MRPAKSKTNDITTRGRALAAALLLSTGLLSGSVALTGTAFAQATAARAFSIPAGPLGPALAAFGRQAGLQVTYNPAIAANKRSAGVSGTLAPDEALGRLLQGSGLTYTFPNPATVAISDPAGSDNGGAGEDGSLVLDTITVEGESAWGQTRGFIATHDATATKTDTPIIEIPQAINVVTRRQIEAQGAQNVTEATRYTPGVVAAFGDSDSRNDVQQSRGFFVRYNLNGSRLPYGAYSAAFLRIEPYGLERIDVLKGPSSVLYGQNLPGGLINLWSKQPTAEPQREVGFQTGSHGRLQGMFDFSGPIDAEKKFLYRFSGLGRDTGGRVDFGYDRRLFLAPAFTWQPTPATSLTLLGHYQKDDTISDYASLPAAGTLRPNPNGRIPVTRYAGEPHNDGYEREQYAIGYNFRHDFNDSWTLRQNLQFNHVDVDLKASPAALMDATQRYLTRVATHGMAGADSFTVDTNITGKFTTGPLSHTLLGGVDYLHLDDRYRFESGVYGGTFDLFNPVYGAPMPVRIPRIDYKMTRKQLGVYAQDQIGWENWRVTAGFRNDWVEADSVERLGRTSFEADESAFTGRVGLTYLFDAGFAPYVAYSTSFDPVDGVTPTGGPLKPLKGRQIEAGIKYQPPSSRSFITIAAFQIEQENVTAPNPDPTGTGQLQAGEGRVRGVEFEAKAELADNFTLIASYAYANSKVTKANEGTQHLLGKELVNVPDHQASAWLDYKFVSGPLAGFGLGGGVRYQGYSYGDQANAFEVGGYVLADAALSYDFGKLDSKLEGLDLRVTGTNIFDRRYVGYCQSALLCYYGQGRTVLATLKYRW